MRNPGGLRNHYVASYYNLSSVTIFVCPLTPPWFMDLQAPYYNLSSDCTGESQGGNPIGKALVSLKHAWYGIGD